MDDRVDFYCARPDHRGAEPNDALTMHGERWAYCPAAKGEPHDWRPTGGMSLHDVKKEGTSRVTWEIEPVGDSCRLTVTHDQLREGANDELYGGWPMILSGLKTWLETGELLTTPGSLMYATPAAATKR